MLSLDSVQVKYGELTAVHQASLTVVQGQCLALLGVNGAGKSTLLGAVAGILPIYGGEITYCGKDIRALPVADRVKAGIALVPEGRRVFPLMTVRDNLLMGAYTRPVNGERRMDRLFGEFPILREKEGTLAMHLSGGEQQQLAIARALMGEPALLLLDEPTMGLSPKMAGVVFGFLERLREKGTTMIISSQETGRLGAFCDRVMVMKNGVGRL